MGFLAQRGGRDGSVSPAGAAAGAAAGAPVGAAAHASARKPRGMRGAAQARRLLSPMLRTWYRPVTIGADLVPTRGPALVVANHMAFLDSPLLMGALPRPARLLARDQLFEPPLDKLMATAGQISVRPGADVVAFDRAAEVLVAGELVAVFADDRRLDGQVTTSNHAGAYLALRTGAPIVPVAILGTRRTGMAADALPKRRSRLAIVVGEPFRLETHDDVLRRTVIASAGEKLRQRLADHVADAAITMGIRLPEDGGRIPTIQEAH